MSLSVPSSVLASGWIPFVAVIIIVLIISSIYIKYFTSRTDGEWSSTLSAIFALSITLMTTALIPVDIFLVSFMKDSNGTFKVDREIGRVVFRMGKGQVKITSRTDGEWSSTLSAIFALSITLMTTALIPVDIFLVSFMKDSNGTFKVDCEIGQVVFQMGKGQVKITSRTDGEWSSTLSAIFALSITLMTTALIPVDIFLVSFMKDSNGTFKECVMTEVKGIGPWIGYYTMYGLIVFCMFLLLPFMYFYYEERDEEQQPSCRSRFCGAMKYMIVFLILIFVLLLIGALVHTKPIPNASNSTQFEKMKALFDMESNWIENSLSLVISILSLIGMVALLVYTAYGMAALPMGLIKGHRNIKRERMQVNARKTDTQDRISAIREKYSHGKRMSRRDAREIANLEESEALMKRQERHLEARDTCCQKCWLIFRPFGIIIGIALILIAALVFLSLLFANIDKALNGAGLKFGYTLSKKPTLPNPVDIILVFCQKVFPLDYIVFSLLVFYLVFCSMSGLRNIGIWFFWLRMYKIRPGRTAPQGMMMMCMLLMFINLAINIIMYELTPQYSAYGNQHFWNTTSGRLEVCSTKNTQDECVMTRMALLLTRFFYKMWFFGAAYYWGTWGFLLFILIGFVVASCKKSKSAIDGEVDADDIVDSDEELIDG